MIKAVVLGAALFAGLARAPSSGQLLGTAERPAQRRLQRPLLLGGPLTAGAFCERNQISNPLPAPLASGDRKTDWTVGAACDFTVVKAFLTHGRAKSDKLAPSAKTTSLGASVPVGGGSILAGIARTSVTPADVQRTTTTLGYD
jgi:hypothetical protein